MGLLILDNTQSNATKGFPEKRLLRLMPKNLQARHAVPKRTMECRMSFKTNPNPCLSGFEGLVRLFPLPNLVMFPGVIKGLHIFESRYCKLLEESLSTDELIAMTLLRPGWETQYLGSAPIHDVICIGKIVQCAQTSEGRHNILLYGLKRARIVQEISTSNHGFRRAEVILMDDLLDPAESSTSSQLAERLVNAFRKAFPSAYLFTIFSLESVRTIPLGSLTDLITHEIPMTLGEKQALLSECVVQNRVDRLLKFLGNGSSPNGNSTVSGGIRPFQAGDGYSSGFSLN